MLLIFELFTTWEELLTTTLGLCFLSNLISTHYGVIHKFSAALVTIHVFYGVLALLKEFSFGLSVLTSMLVFESFHFGYLLRFLFTLYLIQKIRVKILLLQGLASFWLLLVFVHDNLGWHHRLRGLGIIAHFNFFKSDSLLDGLE